MPAVAITKVCPTDRMMRIAAATSIDSMFPAERNVGFNAPKMTMRATRPTRAAHSAQKPTSLARADQVSDPVPAGLAVVVVLGIVCSLASGAGRAGAPVVGSVT